MLSRDKIGHDMMSYLVIPFTHYDILSCQPCHVTFSNAIQYVLPYPFMSHRSLSRHFLLCYLQEGRRFHGAGGKHGDNRQTVWKLLQVGHIKVQEIAL